MQNALNRSRSSVLSRIPSVPEQIILDLQKTSVSECLISRTEKNLHRFTKRQLVLLLHRLSADVTEPSNRRLTHRVSLCLTQDHIGTVSLKEIAMAVNAFARGGIRNEIFFARSVEVVKKRLKQSLDTQSSASSTALLLSGYVRMQLGVDRALFEHVLRDLLPTWCAKNFVNETDAVCWLVVAEKTNLPLTDQVLAQLVDKLESADKIIAALSSVGKLEGNNRQRSPKLTRSIENAFGRITSSISTMSSLSRFKKIQLFHAVACLDPATIDQPQLVSIFESAATSLMASEGGDKDKINSLSIMFLTGVSKCGEKLTKAPHASNILFKSVTWCEQNLVDVNDSGMAVLINTMATLNIQISDKTKNLIAQHFLNNLCSDGQTMSMVFLGLSKLNELPLLAQIAVAVNNPSTQKNIFRTSTQQSIDYMLLSMAILMDASKGCPALSVHILNNWITPLIQMNSAKKERKLCAPSVSQNRLANVMLEPFSAVTVMPDVSAASQWHTPGVVSRLHRDVFNTLSAIAVRDIKLNQVDQKTGYEIDILID